MQPTYFLVETIAVILKFVMSMAPQIAIVKLSHIRNSDQFL